MSDSCQVETFGINALFKNWLVFEMLRCSLVFVLSLECEMPQSDQKIAFTAESSSVRALTNDRSKEVELLTYLYNE